MKKLIENNMLKFNFVKKHDQAITILCLGAHSDDIEIGCGGTILKLLEECENVVIYWVVFCSDQKRKKEAKDSACDFLAEAKKKNILINEFRDGFLPFIGGEIKDYFEVLKQKVAPDLIFTHYRSDLHQDHRFISDLTWNTFRDHLILEYEIPKYDGDIGCPNLFLHLTESTCNRKIELILKNFKSQQEKQWFSRETFESIMRLRGIESNAPSKFAEAFYCRKIVFELIYL
jgi:LmbE family N-acetylglucosaminyl deacetylase